MPQTYVVTVKPTNTTHCVASGTLRNSGARGTNNSNGKSVLTMDCGMLMSKTMELDAELHIMIIETYITNATTPATKECDWKRCMSRDHFVPTVLLFPVVLFGVEIHDRVGISIISHKSTWAKIRGSPRTYATNATSPSTKKHGWKTCMIRDHSMPTVLRFPDLSSGVMFHDRVGIRMTTQKNASAKFHDTPSTKSSTLVSTTGYFLRNQTGKLGPNFMPENWDQKKLGVRPCVI